MAAAWYPFVSKKIASVTCAFHLIATQLIASFQAFW